MPAAAACPQGVHAQTAGAASCYTPTVLSCCPQRRHVGGGVHAQPAGAAARAAAGGRHSRVAHDLQLRPGPAVGHAQGTQPLTVSCTSDFQVDSVNRSASMPPGRRWRLEPRHLRIWCWQLQRAVPVPGILQRCLLMQVAGPTCRSYLSELGSLLVQRKSTWRPHQTLTACALLLQAWAGEPDNVKKAQDILYQLAVSNGQAQVGPRYFLRAELCALHWGCYAE